MSYITLFPSGFSSQPIVQIIENHELKITAVALAVLSSCFLIASGGTLTIGFVACKLTEGVIIALLNNLISSLVVEITKYSIQIIHGTISNIREAANFNASLDTIKSSAFYKIIKFALNIITSITYICKSNSHFLSINIGLSLLTLITSSVLLRMNVLPENINASFQQRSHIEEQEIIQQTNLFSLFYLISDVLFHGNLSYENAVQHHVDTIYSQAQAQTGNSAEIIKRAIDKHVENLQEPEKTDFLENQTSLSAEFIFITARLTLLEILETTSAPGMLSRPNYPPLIPQARLEAFKTIHRKFKCLTPELQTAVKINISKESNELQNEQAAEVWRDIRTFASNLTQGNPIFFTSLQEANT